MTYRVWPVVAISISDEICRYNAWLGDGHKKVAAVLLDPVVQNHKAMVLALETMRFHYDNRSLGEFQDFVSELHSDGRVVTLDAWNLDIFKVQLLKWKHEESLKEIGQDVGSQMDVTKMIDTVDGTERRRLRI